MSIHINSVEGVIRIGLLDFFWVNKLKYCHGFCGFEIHPIGDDGYILWMVGKRWKWNLSYDFHMFGKYFSHYIEDQYNF